MDCYILISDKSIMNRRGNDTKILQLQSDIKNRSYENIMLFQPNLYEFKIYTNNNEIESISINIAGEQFNALDSYIEGNYKVFQFDIKRYFSCIWGYSQIVVELKDKVSNETNILYSKLLNIELSSNKEKSNEMKESVKNMVKYIIDNNQLLLQMAVRNKFSIIDNDLQNSEFKTLFTEIEILKEIVACYQNNFEYFMRDSKYKVVTLPKRENFNKIKKITSKTIQNIITNPKELEMVDYYTGIRYVKTNFKPKNSINSYAYKDYGVYENKVILGFIKNLIDYLKERLAYFIKSKNNNFKSGSSFHKTLTSYYEFYFDEINKLLPVLEIIYYKYKDILKCDDICLSRMPVPSRIFIEAFHYRQCFIMMEKWFKKGNYNFEKNKILTYFPSTDQLYEYYCLLNVIDIIQKLGFKLNKSFNYKYKNVKTKYLYDHDNTYCFFSDSYENQYINLYYQPIIYSDVIEQNDITLYRVDGRNTYYTPDFLIKIIKDNNIKYVILDSKWQTRNTIKKYSYDNIGMKYVLSIDDFYDNKIDSVCILQGRNDNKKTYIHQNSNLSNKKLNFNMPKFKIINLTPEENNSFIIRNMLKNILKV